MAALRNPKWESFCRYVALGYSQLRAYRAAGFSSAGSGNASSLAKRPEIVARIQELIDVKIEADTGTSVEEDDRFKRERALVRAGESIDPTWVIDQLMENVRIARENGQIAAANKALEMLGKQIGLFQEKVKPADNEREADRPTTPAIPVTQVNKLLDALGFTGQIDLATMKPLPPEQLLRIIDVTDDLAS